MATHPKLLDKLIYIYVSELVILSLDICLRSLAMPCFILCGVGCK